MTDELTPEERRALESLPRERMPSAGLEDRVVASMRERGVLAPAPRARVIRLTTPRIATLVAAGIALMIGAYSIGMHRGSFRPDVRETLEPRTAEPTIMNETAPVEMPEDRTTPATRPGALSMQSRPEPKAKENVSDEKLDWKLKDTSTRRDAAESAGSAPATGSVATAPEPATPAPAQQFARELDEAAKKKLDAQPSPETLSADRALSTLAKTNERAYQLGEYHFMVDAPDSVRITEESGGRLLVIHRPDGVIRIRAADTQSDTGIVALNRVAPKGATPAREFRLGGHRFTINAPADIRIQEEPEGRTLLIHTPDGPIRLRLAD